jgi:hypothetical protein
VMNVDENPAYPAAMEALKAGKRRGCLWTAAHPF